MKKIKIINKILKIKIIKVLLCILENFIKTINLNLWKFIENKVFNPYDFGETNIRHTQKLYKDILKISKRICFNLNTKKILELGPGGFLGVGAFLKNEGIDKYYVIDDISHFEKIDKKTIKLYNKINNIILIGDRFDGKYIKQLEYNKDGLPLENNSIDLVFSNAVYEHINEPRKSIKELSRITKKGGIGIHIIDFRDHIFNQKGLYFLTISDFIFNFFFKKSGAWVNRKRYSDFVKYFKENGFEILEEVMNHNFNKGEIKKYKNLSKQFDEKDLSISDVKFILKKI